MGRLVIHHTDFATSETWRSRVREPVVSAEDLEALAGLDLSPESLFAPCELTRSALWGEP